MKSKTTIWMIMFLLGGMLFLSGIAFAQEGTNDSLPASRHLIHKIDIETRPGYIIPTNSFLEGDNENWKSIRNSFSAHLRYAFQFHPQTVTNRIYGGVYQGFGLAYYTFGERKQLGNPFAIYLFQGARIAQINPQLSVNYEWNFGLSSGWKPYNEIENPYNAIIGSRINAYLNTNFYLNWVLSHDFDLTSGITLTHFSNGNTKFPNAGLNTVGLKIGLVYKFNRKEDYLSKPLFQPPVPAFPRHISYDLVLFGSWRRKGVAIGDIQIASPDAYRVLGFNFAPMYNIGYKLRVGASLDGVYDESANVYTSGYSYDSYQMFVKPPLHKQLSLGLSGRVEYVMPYFTVGIGLGANVLHGGGDLKALYQTLALKIEVSRNSFINIGYCLHDFHYPNFLMLGIGYRFNNKYPLTHR